MAVTCLNGGIFVPVTDLVQFAYPKESPASLTKQYGFLRDEVYDGFDYGDRPAHSPLQNGTAIHNAYETDVMAHASVSREVPLEVTVQMDGIPVTVHGIADIVAFDGLCHTVEEVKSKSFLPYAMTPFDDPKAVAQAVCYAHMLALADGLPRVRIRITFVKQNRRGATDRISWSLSLSAKQLQHLFDSLLERGSPFFKVLWERANLMPEEIVKCPFPFRHIREGQREFVTEAFRTIKNSGELFVSAPTGIGKTMASLYPAVKGISIGAVDKVFYLTSKNVTGLAALEATRALNRHIPHLRGVLISAKELQCPHRTKKHTAPADFSCELCGNRKELRTDDGHFLSYSERQNGALLHLLYSDDRIYTTEQLTAVAEDFSVCPHELALDLSLYCDIIVCDYNYAFDDAVRLRRYFKDPTVPYKYVFLIDEAHNLPDRVREMYSASVSTELIDELLHLCRGGETEIPTLYSALVNARSYLDTMALQCREGEHLAMNGDQEVLCGYYKNSVLDDGFLKIFATLASEITKEVNGMGIYGSDLAPYKNRLRKLAFVCNFFDQRFCFFAERAGNSVHIDLLCLDPSEIISAMSRGAKAVIQFSATLSPMEYYKTVSGCPKGTELDLPSPYAAENLCLIVYDSISTRFGDRKDRAHETATVIAEAIAAKEGNYIVYFSSYAHMKQVARHFAPMMPEVTMVMQKSGMSLRERERFLSVFGDRRYHNVVGFCVLGGMFSEGIDLSGERLIGAIIVGTGLPGLSATRNIMMEHYDNTMEKGREFAYIYPGMNKVLQAAGRVIRTETDRGMVLLIDDRYSEPATVRLFPHHWRHLRFTGDLDALSHILKDFWAK